MLPEFLRNIINIDIEAHIFSTILKICYKFSSMYLIINRAIEKIFGIKVR